ncbi:MAG: CBS domain-containing protein [Planctomycetes bacterium]|nr:CBS domain-containing protein [Planctomycetota bacterium]MBL7107091.1 CBS domain-containing protein [Phycisphaerae bacterium]
MILCEAVDMMGQSPATVCGEDFITETIRLFSEAESFYYPVVDNQGKLTGSVTVGGMRGES